MKNKFIWLQVIVIIVVLIGIFVFYPRAGFDLNGDRVAFSPGGGMIIIISKNPDFSNARYIDVSDTGASFRLDPGTYYWKSSNGLIESRVNKFTIDSEVALVLDEEEGLENVGNVRIKVTKTGSGDYIGQIVLDPEEGVKTQKDVDQYTGRQDE